MSKKRFTPVIIHEYWIYLYFSNFTNSFCTRVKHKFSNLPKNCLFISFLCSFKNLPGQCGLLGMDILHSQQVKNTPKICLQTFKNNDKKYCHRHLTELGSRQFSCFAKKTTRQRSFSDKTKYGLNEEATTNINIMQ